MTTLCLLSTSSSSVMTDKFPAFLPGLLRVPFDALTKKWPQVILAHLDPWTQIHRDGLPKGLKILENTTPWPFPGPDCNLGWLYGFMAFLVLCMAAQLIDLSEPRENERASEGRDSRHGNARLEVCEEALATVFIPLEKCHTKDYKPVLKSILAPPVPSAGGNAALRLDFENTWKALVTGRLEIKDDDVLEGLFTFYCMRKDGNECDEEGIWAFGCRIAFGFGRAWKMSAVSKILFAYGAVCKERFWWHFGKIGEARGDVSSLSEFAMVLSHPPELICDVYIHWAPALLKIHSTWTSFLSPLSHLRLPSPSNANSLRATPGPNTRTMASTSSSLALRLTSDS